MRILLIILLITTCSLKAAKECESLNIDHWITADLQQVLTSARNKYLVDLYYEWTTHPAFTQKIGDTVNLSGTDYTVVGILGHGGSCVVYRVRTKNRTFAYKVFSSSKGLESNLEGLLEIQTRDVGAPEIIARGSGWLLVEEVIGLRIDVILNTREKVGIPTRDRALIKKEFLMRFPGFPLDQGAGANVILETSTGKFRLIDRD